jgi:hypothetical protein
MRALAASSLLALVGLGCGDAGTSTTSTSGANGADFAQRGRDHRAGNHRGHGRRGLQTGTRPAGTLANSDITRPRREANARNATVHNDSGDSARFARRRRQRRPRHHAVRGHRRAGGREPRPVRRPKSTFLKHGDNLESRTEYVVYRVEEPATLAPGAHTVGADALRFTYPDGSLNAEALFVDPTSGAIHIVTKNANESRIYRLSPPFDTSGTTAASFLGVAAIPDVLPLVTGADMRRDGSAILASPSVT